MPRADGGARSRWVTAAVIPGSTQGFVTLYPSGLPPAVGATVVFTPSLNIEISAIVALRSPSSPVPGAFDVIAGFSDIGLVVDLTGYFTELSQHAWGAGRPGVLRYGTTGASTGLCANGSVTFGLSDSLVNWAEAPQACPAGTWVCTAAERGSGVCDTARPDTTCDSLSCDSSTCSDLPSNNHVGGSRDRVDINIGRTERASRAP